LGPSLRASRMKPHVYRGCLVQLPPCPPNSVNQLIRVRLRFYELLSCATRCSRAPLVHYWTVPPPPRRRISALAGRACWWRSPQVISATGRRQQFVPEATSLPSGRTSSNETFGDRARTVCATLTALAGRSRPGNHRTRAPDQMRCLILVGCSALSVCAVQIRRSALRLSRRRRHPHRTRTVRTRRPRPRRRPVRDVVLTPSPGAAQWTSSEFKIICAPTVVHASVATGTNRQQQPTPQASVSGQGGCDRRVCWTVRL
jgi:hypothetical protein